MRIVTAAVFFAAATWGAEASSFVVIADGGPIQTPSVQVLTDADAPLVAASVLEIGLPDPVKTAALPLDGLVPVLEGLGFSANVAGLYREMTEAMGQGRITWDGTGRRVRGRVTLDDVLARGLKG